MYFETLQPLGNIPEFATVSISRVGRETITIVEYQIHNCNYVPVKHELPIEFYNSELYRPLEHDEPAYRDLFKDIAPEDFVRDNAGDLYYVYGIRNQLETTPLIEAHGLDVENMQWCKAEYIDPNDCRKVLRSTFVDPEKTAVDIATFMGLPT